VELCDYIDDLGSGSRTVTKVVSQAKRRDRVSVFVDGEFAFGLSDEVAVRHGIRPGIAIDRLLLEPVNRDEAVASCKRTALRYLSYRMRSEREIRRRLAKDGASLEAIDAVLGHLREIGLVDDDVFAKAFARDATITRKWGPHRIARGLRQAGVDPEAVEHALAEVRHQLADQNAVQTLAAKRWNQLYGVNDLIRRKKRVYDYLLRKGFDYDEIRRAVDSLSS